MVIFLLKTVIMWKKDTMESIVSRFQIGLYISRPKQIFLLSTSFYLGIRWRMKGFDPANNSCSCHRRLSIARAKPSDGARDGLRDDREMNIPEVKARKLS